METWKGIKGFEGIYEVSDLGRVRTCKGKTTYTEKHGIRHWKQRILKPKGYTPKTGFRITLWKDGKQKDYLVARLVAFTFLGGDISDRKLTVNHKDGNRMNNNIDNLELISLADNIRHGFETGLYTSQKQVKIKNLITNKTIIFRSHSLASRYLGKNNGFINLRIKKQKYVIDDLYKIELEE